MLTRVRAALACHRVSVSVLTPLLVLVGVMHGVGMSSYPAFFDDEGTYMAQAWAVQSQHALSPYTYWYDHPPLGWLLLAGWTTVARVFERHTPAVVVGRQAMWLVSLASVVVVYVLARRLAYRRATAWFAAAIFSLSPLAITYQRMVFLDNIAVLWLLLAFVFVLSPSRRLWAYAAAGGCLAAAVLSKETMLLAAPAVLWQAWRQAETRTRPFCIAMLGSVFVFASATYPLFALLKGELFPGTGHVSLFTALRFQLVTRPGTGSVFDAHSASHAIVTGWLHLDPWLLIVGCALIPAGFAVPRLRPLTTALALEAVVVLRSGYLPAPQVLVLLPFAALLITGVAQEVTDAVRARLPARRTTAPSVRFAHRGIAMLAALPIVVFPAVVSPDWLAAYRVAAAQDLTSPVVSAERWTEQHVSHTARLLVDDVVWIDLVRAGFNPRLRVVWFYKLDFSNNPDPSVQQQLPGGWRDFDYVIVTPTMRSALDSLPGGLTQLRAAITHSFTVAAFGHGDSNVEIRQIGNRPRHAAPTPAQTVPPCPRAAIDLVRRLAAFTGIPTDLASDIWAGCRPSDEVLRRAEAIIASRRAATRAVPNAPGPGGAGALLPQPPGTAPGPGPGASNGVVAPGNANPPPPSGTTTTTTPEVTPSPTTTPASTTTVAPSPSTTTPTPASTVPAAPPLPVRVPGVGGAPG